jgi:Transposase zinc-ribbon domain
MADGLLQDLPRDLPTFLERFGTDAACRAYLVRARWPEGFGCGGCGHDQAYSHNKRLIEECAACGKQHSILAGTIFEQTKTGLARWFLAIYLVTSSKGRPRRFGQDGGGRRGREPARPSARSPARPPAAAGGARRLGPQPR